MTDHVTETSAYASHDDQQTSRLSPGMVFLWFAMILNLAWFLPFAVSTGSGIISSVIHSAGQEGRGSGGADLGGIGWVLIDIVGVVVLGIALVYGLWRYHTRSRVLDPVNDAVTQAQYDNPNAARS